MNPVGLRRLIAVAKLLGELLSEILGSLVRGLVYSLWLKALTWMSTRIHSRAGAIVVGLLMAALLFLLMPAVTGLLSY